MNIINVGFNSKNWNLFVEGSDEYQALTLAVEEGKSIVSTHIFNTINNILNGDYSEAYREAHNAIKASKGEATGGIKTVHCPYCNGDGVIEVEGMASVQNYHSQEAPEYSNEMVSCDACKGEGTIDSDDIINDYAGESYPEHVVMSVIKGDMASAKDLAQAVKNEIDANASKNLEKSIG